MDQFLTTLSMLIGMMNGFVSAFDLPVVCPSLSDTGIHGSGVKVADTLGSIPLSELMSRDWTGICRTNNGLAFNQPLLNPEAVWVVRWS